MEMLPKAVLFWIYLKKHKFLNIWRVKMERFLILENKLCYLWFFVYY